MDFDTYQDFLTSYEQETQKKLIPASTVILLKDTEDKDTEDLMKVLLVKRNPELKFVGGSWVFPGGKVDPEDFDTKDDLIAAGLNAAVREAKEETNLEITASQLVRFSHWVPPPVLPKLFATWFFLAPAPEGEVTVDGGEICDHIWLTPAQAIQKRDTGEFEFAPPTFITLNELANFNSTNDAIQATAQKPNLPFYATKIVNHEGATIALWGGDAGYENADPSIAGERHRLEISKKIWQLENTLPNDTPETDTTNTDKTDTQEQ